MRRAPSQLQWRPHFVKLAFQLKKDCLVRKNYLDGSYFQTDEFQGLSKKHGAAYEGNRKHFDGSKPKRF